MKLYHEVHPNLAKENTLFLHGNLASSAWWRPSLKEWGRKGSLGDGALVFADWRGCGQNESWAFDRAFSLKELAEDYLDLLNELKMERVALVGHSLGGLIAQELLVLAPERFSRAVLLDPVGPKGVVFDESMYEAFRQMALSEELTRIVVLSTIYQAERLSSELAAEISRDAFKAVRGIGRSVLEILKTVNLESSLAHTKTPTLILHGREDQVIPVADSESLSRILPESRLEILPNVGHCWNIEDPGAFVQRLRAWL